MEALDWQGELLSCRDCPHQEIRARGLCNLGQTCVRDRRSRRIDHFFSVNPFEAGKYLYHPYFEVRVGAAKYASVFLLTPLLDDEEPDVRAMVAQRLPLRLAQRLLDDPEPKVRMALAQRVDGRALVKLLRDSDVGVRLIAARRAPAELLPLDERPRCSGAPPGGAKDCAGATWGNDA